MLLSRNTYAVYWMSRYLERAENMARLLDVNFHLLMDRREGGADWSPFIAVTADEGAFRERYPDAGKRHVLQFLVCDPEYPNSVLSCLQMARQNALQVRDSLTAELWEGINRAFLFVKDQGAFPEDHGPQFFEQLRSLHRQYLGNLDATLNRDEVWQFCRLGHFVERADKTSRVLDVRYFMLQNAQEIPWAALLKAVDALEMYRKSCRVVQPASVLRFLLMDELFPRSVLYCVKELEILLMAILQGQPDAPHFESVRQLRALKTWLHAEASSDFIEHHLHDAIDELQSLLNRFDEALHEEFFEPQAATSWMQEGGLAQ